MVVLFTVRRVRPVALVGVDARLGALALAALARWRFVRSRLRSRDAAHEQERAEPFVFARLSERVAERFKFAERRLRVGSERIRRVPVREIRARPAVS